jgi:exopolysaccharide/PEP-CTERM locus tyrosine autokinase
MHKRSYKNEKARTAECPDNKTAMHYVERLRNKMYNNIKTEFCNSNSKIDNPYIVTLNDPDSPIAEEYRNLKTMIVRTTQGKVFRNTLIVTSALSGEGKSISSINLAITLSQEYDYRVLLVDADLRDPSLHKYLNLKADYGLSDYLMDGIDINRTLIRTGINKLTLLPAGRNVSNPVELLSSRKMKELIVDMKHRYPDRYIIIDTPPVLPFAETRFISTVVDGIILVVSEGKLSLQSIPDTLNIIKKNGNLIGIIYNNVSIENLDNSYGHYYKRYKGYREHKKRV